jgi:hypothetical protein
MINDLETYEEYHYYEEVKSRSGNIEMVEDKQALWQALVGEIKTKKGECLLYGLTDYGTDLWRILGQNYDNLTVKEIEKYIKDLERKYPEISSLTVEKIDFYLETIAITLKMESIFGIVTGEVVGIGGPC